jgi:hypothetical protein
MAAQGFFVGALAVAVSKTTAITSTSSLFVNVEAHSIAFSALYFWIIPAVFLSAMIGVSQTEKNISRILENLPTAPSHEIGPNDTHIRLPNVPTISERERQERITNGGIYSWQPESNLKGLWPSVMVSFLPFFTVSSGTITAMLVSGFVPADGWQPRHCAHASFLLTWIFSFLATNWLKQLGGKNFPRFWITFAKDVLATVGTLAAMMYIQVGPFNNCSSYTLWGRKGLALPGMPEVEAILNSRMRNVYPAIAFTSIGIQLVLIPLVVFIWSPRALRVLLQSDDETSFWPRWLSRPFGRAGSHEIQLHKLSSERVNPPSNFPNASRSHERLNTPSNFPRDSRGREVSPPEALRSPEASNIRSKFPKSSIDETTIEASSCHHAPQSSPRTTKKFQTQPPKDNTSSLGLSIKRSGYPRKLPARIEPNLELNQP